LVARAVVLVIVASACSSGSASTPTSPSGSAAPPRRDKPADVVAVNPPAAPVPPAAPPGASAQKTLDIALRSSPAGARAAVDGVPVGNTPTHFAMEADGRLHDFTFDRPGFVFVRYRFIPVQSGVIHARLNPVAVEEPTSSTTGVESDDVRQAPEAQAQPPEPIVPGQPATTPPPPPSAKPMTKVGPEP
jgi:hypothetical protein